MENITKNSFGVVYVATGQQCASEVIKSAKSLRTSNPSVQVVAFTDQSRLVLLKQSGIFNNVLEVNDPSYNWNDKIFGFINTPFQRTIIIDTDTAVIGDISEIFGALEYADLLAVQSPRQFNFTWEKTEYPACIVQHNTGVVAFNSNETTEHFFRQWQGLRIEHLDVQDQVTFRKAVLKTGINIKNLPNEYNCRLGVPQLLVGEVKLLHYGKFYQLSENRQTKIIRNINKFVGVRAWVPKAERTIRKNSALDVCVAAVASVFMAVNQLILKMFKQLVNGQLMGKLVARVRRVVKYGKTYKPSKFASTGEYWEERYKYGGISGQGSYGVISKYKAEVINSFIKEKKVNSMIDFGSGDGNQAALFEVDSYVGLDISESSVKRCNEMYRDDKTKNFTWYRSDDFEAKPYFEATELGVSLEVLFHLVEEKTFHQYLKHLFQSSDRFVLIYASDYDEAKSNHPHIKRRKFSTWVTKHVPNWKLIKKIDNPFPYKEGYDKDASVHSDFYIYQNLDYDEQN
jgi:hypothetical protein